MGFKKNGTTSNIHVGIGKLIAASSNPGHSSLHQEAISNKISPVGSSQETVHVQQCYQVTQNLNLMPQKELENSAVHNPEKSDIYLVRTSFRIIM